MSAVEKVAGCFKLGHIDAQQPKNREVPMIIKDVRVTLLRLPYREQPALSAGYDKDREVLVVEIETASGLVGMGYQLYLREGFKTTKACLEEMMIPLIVGKDASADEAFWRDLW